MTTLIGTCARREEPLGDPGKTLAEEILLSPNPDFSRWSSREIPKVAEIGNGFSW